MDIIHQVIILANLANQFAGMQRLQGTGPRISLLATNVVDTFEQYLPKPLPPTTDPKSN